MKTDCTTCPDFFDRDCGIRPACHQAEYLPKGDGLLGFFGLSLAVGLLGTAAGVGFLAVLYLVMR